MIMLANMAGTFQNISISSMPSPCGRIATQSTPAYVALMQKMELLTCIQVATIQSQLLQYAYVPVGFCSQQQAN